MQNHLNDCLRRKILSAIAVLKSYLSFRYCLQYVVMFSQVESKLSVEIFHRCSSYIEKAIVELIDMGVLSVSFNIKVMYIY